MQWTACRVMTGQEYNVRKKILNVIPTAQIEVPRKYYQEMVAGVIKTKSERMLPGYIIVGTEDQLDGGLLKDFVKVLGKITQEEYERVKVQEERKIEGLIPGAKVIVIDGPFQGCRGNMQSDRGDGTWKCRLVFQGMELAVNLKPELLSSID